MGERRGEEKGNEFKFFMLSFSCRIVIIMQNTFCLLIGDRTNSESTENLTRLTDEGECVAARNARSADAVARVAKDLHGRGRLEGDGGSSGTRRVRPMLEEDVPVAHQVLRRGLPRPAAALGIPRARRGGRQPRAGGVGGRGMARGEVNEPGVVRRRGVAGDDSAPHAHHILLVGGIEE